MKIIKLLAAMLFWPGSFLTTSAIMAQTPQAATLEEALWEGTLTIKLNGPMHSQNLENKLNERGAPIGFTKEKSRLRLTYDLNIHFFVNALGEITMAGQSGADGNKEMRREYWYQFQEEIQVEKTNIKTKRMVRVSETSTYKYNYSSKNTFSDEDFDGTFRVLPSGRMDKKGVLRIQGDLDAVIDGKGRALFTKERQPAGSWDKETSQADASTRLVLPISFEAELPHRKDAVTGTVKVDFSTPNPFVFPDADPDKKPDVLKNAIEASGTLSIKPLFQKKGR